MKDSDVDNWVQAYRNKDSLINWNINTCIISPMSNWKWTISEGGVSKCQDETPEKNTKIGVVLESSNKCKWRPSGDRTLISTTDQSKTGKEK